MTAAVIIRLGIQILLLWSSSFIFSMILFRFPVKQYLNRIITSVILLTQISLLLQIQTFSPVLIPIIQIVASIGTFVFILRFPWVYSAIMALVPYILLGFIETMTNFIVLKFSVYNTIEYLKQTPGSLELLIMIFLINLLSWILHKTRIGFTFVSRMTHQPMQKELITIVLSIIGLCFVMALGLHIEWLFIIGFLGSFLITIGLIYVYYHKEYTED